jgi:nucleoside diphosphate kinase
VNFTNQQSPIIMFTSRLLRAARTASNSRGLVAAVAAAGGAAATAAIVVTSDTVSLDAPSLLSFFPEQESIYRRSADLQVQVSGKTNSAFVFIKPHAAASDKVKDLVRAKFKASGIRITGEGQMDAQTIDEKMYIDTHYGAIASKAMKLDPKELNVPAKGKAAFEQKFGETWDDMVAAGRVYNAKQACAKLGIDGATLEKKLGDKIKFGGGFYAFQVDDIWVMNGFYMSMRGSYTDAGSNGIHYFTVQWPTDTLSWGDFRGEVLGSTDPGAAKEGSARRMIYDDWEALGLPGQPNTGDNGVHASASPFEAMAERHNWLGMSKEEDPFALGLMAAGIDAKTVESWQEDPQVNCGGERGSLFDFLEDLDADDCISKSTSIQ